MTLRPGSYNASRPRWRGVIRGDGYPWYVCVHEHESQREATACAKAAREAIKGTPLDARFGVVAPTADCPLPEGWEVFSYRRHADL